MNTENIEDYVVNLAEVVGFDLETGAWLEEPSELQRTKPGLPIALSRLFLALRCASPSDPAKQMAGSQDRLSK